MVYNWTNVSQPGQLLAVPNEATNDSFWLIINFMVWIVALIIFMPFGWEASLLASLFLGLLVSLFLSYMGLIAFGWFLFFLGFLLFMFIYIMWKSAKPTA